MSDVRPPQRDFITTFEDSRRWHALELEPGDIVISAPPKSGTTWMQGIISSLLWPAGDAPGTRLQRSPWIDERITPIADLAALIERQTHRRFVKTHTPADALPIDPRLRYVVVYRDGRDVLMSWANHRAKMRPEVVEVFNAIASADDADTIATSWDGDLEALFEEWIAISSPVRHLRAWWPLRHEPFVHFVHYNDLLTDLEGEMRRLAAILDIEVTDEAWPEVVARCHIDHMRAEADAAGRLDDVFVGGAAAFFNAGTNGRWRGVLPDRLQARYLDLVDSELDAEASNWLASGSRATGRCPGESDAAQEQQPAVPRSPRRRHPIFHAIAQGPTGATASITERRIRQARDEGFFDDLPGAGKPIADLDRHRPEGWWAERFVRRERDKVRAIELEERIRSAKPALWRSETPAAVEAQVRALNALIDDYNRVTTLAPMEHIDAATTLQQWRRLRRG